MGEGLNTILCQYIPNLQRNMNNILSEYMVIVMSDCTFAEESPEQAVAKKFPVLSNTQQRTCDLWPTRELSNLPSIFHNCSVANTQYIYRHTQKTYLNFGTLDEYALLVIGSHLSCCG